jgi:hypothetical protein
MLSALLLLGINSLFASCAYSETLSWDIDNDGSADALTDGLLLLRFSFDLRGDALTNGAISTESNLSPAEVEASANSIQAIADIDANGSVDALTDGLLLLRYLFDVSGNSLINGAIATNATRLTEYEINQYIENYLPSSRLSKKRGIGYGTGGGQQELSPQDLNVIDGRMAWFYNWGRSPSASVSGIYPTQNIDFTPMLWGRNSNEDEVRQFLDNSPETKYLLGFNEPTHLNQANMTPQEAANLWPILEGIADDYDLKLVSPAVGNSSIYGAWEYLDAFFEACSNCRVDYIAVHKYGKDQENFKEFIRESYQYGKPVWITEYAGAGGYAGAGWPDTADDHIEFLANTTRWLESEVNVYRYSWFVGRSGKGIQNWPYNSLLGEDGETTALGELYFSIPSTDYLYQTGVKIPAVGANNLNGIDYIEISDGDNIIATILDSSGNSYLEFDFDIQESQTYKLEIRVATSSNTSLTLLAGQESLQKIQINTGSLSNWHTVVSDAFELGLGKKTLRIVTDSNTAITSVKLVTPETLSEPVSTPDITVGESTAFIPRDDSTWTHAIPLAFLSDGASSQGAQTLSINITELPPGGANYRVIKTNANGFWFSINPQELVLGNNIITVEGESFDRAVRVQISSPNIRFNALSVTGTQRYPEPNPEEIIQISPISVGESTAFTSTNNEIWTNVITLTRPSDGASSQSSQTLSINITELPATGANYRVYKTTANGNDYFGNAEALALGNNIITVTPVAFDRAVKIQLTSPDVKFDNLFVNGTQL